MTRFKLTPHKCFDSRKIFIFTMIFTTTTDAFIWKDNKSEKKNQKLNSNVRLNEATVMVSQTGSSPVGGGVRPVWPPASTLRLVADTAAGRPTLLRHLNLQRQKSWWFLPLWTLKMYRDLQDTELGCRDCPEGGQIRCTRVQAVFKKGGVSTLRGRGYLSEGGGVFLTEGRRSQLAGVKRIQLPQIDLTVKKTEISRHSSPLGHWTFDTFSSLTEKNCIIFH